MHIHVIGDSHIGCLSAAYKDASRSSSKPTYGVTFHPLGGGAIAYDLLVRDHLDRRVLNPLLRTAIVAANRHLASNATPNNQMVAICVGGYVSSVYTWDRKRGVYDLLLDGDGAIAHEPDPNVMLVPVSLIRESLQAHMQVMFNALREVKQQTRSPVVLFSPPPPYRSSVEIVQRMSAKRAVRPDQVPQPLHEGVRLKVWKIAHELLQRNAMEIGLPLVNVPSNTVDADGYLLSSLYGDGFHAGTAYGALMLDALEAQARKIAGVS